MGHRFLVLLFIVFLAFSWNMYNLIKINIFSYDIFRRKLEYYTTFEVYTSPERGNILDRNGEVLSFNTEETRIVLHKSKYNLLTNDQQKFVKNFIQSRFKINDFDDLINESYSEQIVIRSNPNFSDICLVMENLMYVYGVDVVVDYKRQYSGPAFAFTLGFVNIPYKEDVEKNKDLFYYSSVGKDGLELVYDKELRGKLGKEKYLIDPLGQPVKILQQIPPERGKDVNTTIDKKITLFSYKKLKDLCDNLSLKNGQPVGGSVILMKVNGEIITLVSYPSFYVYSTTNGIYFKPDRNEVMKKFPDFSYLYNRALRGEYPAASTFKIITSVAALEEGIINENTHIYCPGVFFVGSHPFYCFNKYGHGSLDVIHALAVSCDVFYYFLGYKLGIEKIKKYAEILGLNKPTGIDLPFESSGLIPSHAWKERYMREEWTKGDDVNIAIGQGLGLVTPLQMAVVVASVATGFRPTPFINKERKPKLQKIPVKEKNLLLVRKGMEEAINMGTAAVIKSIVRKYRVAGKTGTAEVPVNSNNPKGLNNTWFVGYFGVDKPEYVIVVSLEASGGYGGQYAATLAAEIISYMEKSLL